MQDEEGLRLVPQVRYAAAGGVGVLRTVEQAIEWIDREAPTIARPLLQEAKSALQRADAEQTTTAATEARRALERALIDARLFRR